MPDAIHTATLRVRAGLLREMVKREAKLERLYGARLEKLQKKLRGVGAKKVPAIIERELRALVKEVTPQIRDGIQQGVQAGHETVKEQFKAIFKDETIPALSTSAERMTLVGDRMRGALYVDKIPLSRRLWSNTKRTGEQMAKQIQASLRAGNGMEQIAKEIIAKKPPAVSMPKYISDLADAAKQASELGQPNLFEEVLDTYRKQIDKLGSAAGPLFDARSNTRQFIEGVRGATPKQIDAQLRRYMEEKARQHAVMIARTETIHAYRDGYKQSVEGEEWVKGIKWNLGRSHPQADICDVLANQDLDGLGPGGYKVENIPENPHPNCMCYTTSISDEDFFKRKVAKLKGEKQPPEDWKSDTYETGAEWIARQPKSTQLEILGPTRAKLLKEIPDEVVDPKTGKIALVRDLVD